MKTFTCVIEGTQPLLQHRFGEASESEHDTRRIKVERGTPREEAEKVAYRAPDGSLYFPGTAISRVLREAGVGHKMRGSRKTLKFIVPSAVLMLDDAVRLLSVEDRKTELRDFEVDSRPVTIPATKGRVMRHRPRIEKWAARFNLRVADDTLDEKTVRMLLSEGGERLGIGDYRPEKGGPFGTFHVVEWFEMERYSQAAE